MASSIALVVIAMIVQYSCYDFVNSQTAARFQTTGFLLLGTKLATKL